MKRIVIGTLVVPNELSGLPTDTVYTVTEVSGGVVATSYLNAEGIEVASGHFAIAQLREATEAEALQAAQLRMPPHVRINNALKSMRYGGMMHFEFLKEDDNATTSLNKIARNLTNMSKVLVDISDRSQEKDIELSKYRGIVSAFRELATLVAA